MVKEEESEGKNTIGMDTNAKAVVMIGRIQKNQGRCLGFLFSPLSQVAKSLSSS